MNTIFNVQLDVNNYKHLWINHEHYNDDKYIINANKDINEAFWQKNVPNIPTASFIELEDFRLKNGAFINVKGEKLFLPPDYYFFLQYGVAGDVSPEFRLKALGRYHKKLSVRNNPKALGTVVMKNRQDGETTMTIATLLWEMLEGVNYYGNFGIQSKTNEDGYKPCWRTFQTIYRALPRWFKDIYFNGVENEKNIETSFRIVRENSKGVKAKNLYASFYPAVYNAMDGQNNMLRCVLDEFAKWKICSILKTLNNYKQFIAPGRSRKGIFDVLGTPSDTNGKWNDEAQILWKQSSNDILDANGVSESGLLRIYSNPLDGIEGFYDKYGDVNPDEIAEHIKNKRKKAPKGEELSEIRAYPLNESEMFGSFENSQIWSNYNAIVARKDKVLVTDFKNEQTLEKKYQWGNLEWKDGRIDTEVVFKPYDGDCFDITKARWRVAYLPKYEAPLTNVYRPNRIINSILGVDPFNLRMNAKDVKRQSNGAGVVWRFRENDTNNFIPKIDIIYCCRPVREVFFEDMIKTAVFTRSKVQYERSDTKLQDYFEDRGYFDWLFEKRGESKDSNLKGDAPKQGGAFVNEGINIIDALMENQDVLDAIWFEDFLDNIINFDPTSTQQFDIAMAFIQCLIGEQQVSKKVSKNSGFASAFQSFYG